MRFLSLPDEHIIKWAELAGVVEPVPPGQKRFPPLSARFAPVSRSGVIGMFGLGTRTPEEADGPLGGSDEGGGGRPLAELGVIVGAGFMRWKAVRSCVHAPKFAGRARPCATPGVVLGLLKLHEGARACVREARRAAA